MRWSPQQDAALQKAADWLRNGGRPFFYLAGYAGTGKTTLAKELASLVKGEVAFAAFTGKAARVLNQKGCHGASTIHSLIYETREDPVTGELRTSRRPAQTLESIRLIIIDECSMVNEAVGKDLLSFGIPVLVLGDPAQLPPVQGAGYFTNGEPDFMLTEVHRQAAESPIIQLATQIRSGTWDRGEISTEGLVVVDSKRLEPWRVTSADTIIVGRNDTRRRFNNRMREIRKLVDPYPQPGETLICLRNDSTKQICNGEIFTVKHRRLMRDRVSLTLLDAEDLKRPPVEVRVRREFFTQEDLAAKLPRKELRGTQQLTYGYAITGHKSQGSQWNNVCAFDESYVFREEADRWLYTVVTRAAEHLTLVI